MLFNTILLLFVDFLKSQSCKEDSILHRDKIILGEERKYYFKTGQFISVLKQVAHPEDIFPLFVRSSPITCNTEQ